MTHTAAVRFALGYLALNALFIGLWAVLAPRSFYDDFPGLGRSWVSVDGPYNEHLLALAVLLLAAAFTVSLELVTTAGLASFIWSGLHLIYHAFNTEGLGTSDNILSLGGLVLATAFPLLLIFTARRLETVPSVTVS